MNNFKQVNSRVKTAKGRKISSTKWLQRQLNDPYVNLSKQNGYRSRASFKILDINKKFKIFKKGQKVLDLGSAPGGWSQVISKIVGANNLVALDILYMNPINGVKFIQQDFLEDGAEEKILKEINNEKFDVIMSDMAMNTTGNKDIDHLKTFNLVESAYNLCQKILKNDGVFITKIFQGKEEPKFFNELKKHFKKVQHFKPESSRKESVEVYIVAIGYKE